MTPEEKESLKIVNDFCINLQKLKDLVDKEGKHSEEWAPLVRIMRNQYRDMFWKHQKGLEKWRDLLNDLGFFDKEADLKIDVSNVDKEKEVQPEGRFEYTNKIVSEKGNITYQYNEWSIPRDELPEKQRREIYEKSMRNIISTDQGIMQGIQGDRRRQSRSPDRWSLSEYERDWS